MSLKQHSLAQIGEDHGLLLLMAWELGWLYLPLLSNSDTALEPREFAFTNMMPSHAVMLTPSALSFSLMYMSLFSAAEF